MPAFWKANWPNQHHAEQYFAHQAHICRIKSQKEKKWALTVLFEAILSKELFHHVLAAHPLKDILFIPSAWPFDDEVPCPSARPVWHIRLLSQSYTTNPSGTSIVNGIILQGSPTTPAHAVLQDRCIAQSRPKDHPQSAYKATYHAEAFTNCSYTGCLQCNLKHSHRLPSSESSILQRDEQCNDALTLRVRRINASLIPRLRKPSVN
ncbi:hypothetical protein EDD18DRAFT_340858 [Armillaria luteobubalina]|uniref:Uncharacterized protein n=1 Tax=Armillaria luteobubalina TaxID=153913 RepID=A0AA39Q2D8_9AGAR|nr:hypothetical protein EDD18DRAFT_340858 [Armillaria luteobubalina]